MKFSTIASVVVLSTASVDAFAPAPSFTQRTTTPLQTPQTQLRLLPDPITAASAIQSTSAVLSLGEFADTLGSLALLGSVGFGVAFSNSSQKDWSYEYKPGNELSDLAVLGESPASVAEKATTEAQREFFNQATTTASAVAAPPKKAPAPKKAAAPKKGAPPKAAKAPSKELLESVEKANAQVKKVGIKETKSKMESKNSSSAPVKETAVASSSSTEVAETKAPGGKRRFAKGLTLIVAAGAVAVARNLVKAYLGKSML